jgi:rare lipoprotein A
MDKHRCDRRLHALLFAAVCSVFGLTGLAQAHAPESAAGNASIQRGARVAKPQLDRSGRKRIGTASVYSRLLEGRKMADGVRMDPHDDNAASKTLPLGTKARVTNLETGRSATVTIQDRGPYVKARIVDLSPATAEKIGISPQQGVAKVEVAPIAVPSRESGRRN